MKTKFIYVFSAFLLLHSACKDDEVITVPNNGEDTVVTPASTFNRAMVASYNTVFNNSTIEAIERKGVLISWRWLSGDPDDIAFDIYRKTGGGTFRKLNPTPITNSSNYKDLTADITLKNEYQVRISNTEEILCSCTFTPEMARSFYRSIPLNMNDLPATTEPYKVSDAAIGDLDGDGEYEIVIKRETTSIDNSYTGLAEGSCLLEAYRLSNGAFMWRIDLGINIRQGSHYTPFIVYDLNGDGKAELAVRTSEMTKFGDEKVIGDTNNDGRTDYVNRDPKSATYGKILEGPEFLSVIDGITGAEIARTDYIGRGVKSVQEQYWGDKTGNRMDRFLMAAGHFSSQKGKASIVMCRGYYKNFQITALDLQGNELKQRWHFDTFPNYQHYCGQGNHNLAVGDVDNDGKDEIIYGACAIDHNGKGLYSTGLGHGDALHLGKFDPTIEGLQVVCCHEEPRHYGDCGAEMRNAATGEILLRIPGNGKDIGRCMVADIVPEVAGCEIWTIPERKEGETAADAKMYSCKGVLLGEAPKYKSGSNTFSCNMGIWWTGSLNRQLLDRGMVIAYPLQRMFEGEHHGVTTAHGTKENPCFYGDIWGDWREEMIYVTPDYTELRIFTTDFETNHRFRPLMEDPIYRLSATHQNIGYNQPTHPGFYLGSDLDKE